MKFYKVEWQENEIPKVNIQKAFLNFYTNRVYVDINHNELGPKPDMKYLISIKLREHAEILSKLL